MSIFFVDIIPSGLFKWVVEYISGFQFCVTAALAKYLSLCGSMGYIPFLTFNIITESFTDIITESFTDIIT